MTILRQRMIEDLRVRNYSERTVETYVMRVAKFALHFGKSPEFLGPEEIRTYQLHLVQVRQSSWTVFNQTVCALRFLYGVCLKREWSVEQIPFPRQERKLPVVLSLEEVSRLFERIDNLKHRTLLMVLYAAGLRLSEALHLRVEDVDSQRMALRVCRGKGAKDRYAPLSETLLVQLREYWRHDRPAGWLFPGRRADSPLTKSAVQRVCKKAALRAGLRKRVSPHTLRHCFATHLLEAGTDLKTIQVLLGHRSLSTTSVYLHVAVQAPGDKLRAVDLLASATGVDRKR